MAYPIIYDSYKPVPDDLFDDVTVGADGSWAAVWLGDHPLNTTRIVYENGTERPGDGYLVAPQCLVTIPPPLEV